MVKVEYRKIKPYGLYDNEIRRKYYLFGILIYTTEWFKLSTLWPGMMATETELKKACDNN